MSDAPTAGWLDALDVLLAPLGVRGIALLGARADAPDGEWQASLPAGTPVLERSARCAAQGGGWVLRLRAAPAESPRLWLRADAGTAPGEERMADAAVLCRLAWQLRDGGAARAGSPLRDEIHALRNALNSVGMNAAVLTGKSLPPALQEFAGDLDRAVQNSLAALARVSALMPR
jgi:hypothetical protein